MYIKIDDFYIQRFLFFKNIITNLARGMMLEICFLTDTTEDVKNGDRIFFSKIFILSSYIYINRFG